MRQIQYRGQNAKDTFDPIQVSQQGLNNQIRRDEQELSNLKEQARDERQVRDDYLQGLKNKFTQEASNREDLRRLELQTREVRDAAIQQNQQDRLRQQELDRAAQREEMKTFEQLSKFSSSLFEQGIAFKKDYDQRQMTDEYNKALAEGLPLTRQIAQAANESELKLAGETTEGIADVMASNGTNSYTVAQVRTGNKWRDYGRLRAYSEMAGRQYGPWLEEQLAKMGRDGIDPATRAGAIEGLQIEYLKQNGLYGLSADFLGPMFQNMRTANATSLTDARRQSAIELGNKSIEDAGTELYVNPTGENFKNLFNSVSRATGSNNKPRGRKDGLDTAFETVEDITLYPDDEVVLNMLSSGITDNGQSFAERFPTRVSKLMTRRQELREEKLRSEDAAQRADNRRKSDDLKAALVERGDYGQAEVDELRQIMIKEGLPTDGLGDLEEGTRERLDSKQWDEFLTNRFQSGDLSLEYLQRNLQIPPETRNKFVQLIVQDPTYQLASSPKNSKYTVQALQRGLEEKGDQFFQEGSEFSTSFPRVLEAAQRDVIQRAIDYGQASNDPAAAYRKALDEVLLEIEKGAGQYGYNPDTESWTNFMPSQSDDVRTLGDIESSLQKNGIEYLTDPNFTLVPVNQLQELGEEAQQGLRIMVPKVYFNTAQILNEMYPDQVFTPRDVLNMQIKAATGIEPPLMPNAVESLKIIEDPVFRSILNRPSIANQQTAILNTEITSMSSEDRNGRELISLAARLGEDPIDVATAFDIAQVPGTSFEERVLLFEDLVTKQGLSIADIVGDNQELKNQAVLRYGFVDSSADPYRDPAYASPSVRQYFYTTGDQTNGGVSEHLDIKQADDPNTPENEFGTKFAYDELDEYIYFIDPAYGQVTLSQLREKHGTTPGMDFGAPRDYGPHLGWDYPTKKGTRLYLVNGARKISSTPVTGNGMRTVIKLPDGRYFAFLHGE